MVKVLVADGIDLEGLTALSSHNTFRLVEIKDPAQLLNELEDADVLLVRSKTKVNSDLLLKGKKLKYVGRAGVGVDNIDIENSTRRGIVVANVPGGNTISAAEHT
ncbi:MAG: phosphoglycerate dehydrogenase, partial [Elusimicrobia bacterium]|nr:phosphoglycerate dehydrogenase [Elusimicrobiota bacterium]